MTSLSEAKRLGASSNFLTSLPFESPDVVPPVPPPGPVLRQEDQPGAGGTTTSSPTMRGRSKDAVLQGGVSYSPPVLPRFKERGRWQPDESGEWRRLTKPQVEKRTRGANAKRAIRHSNQPITQQEKESMAVLKATGMTDAGVARALKISKGSVGTYTKTPEVQSLIERWRFMFRAQALEQTSGLQLAAWTRVKNSLERDDPKAFDSYTRGLHAMEKVAASAAGENRPPQTNIAVINTGVLPAEEREELLRAFKADIKAEEAVVTPKVE